MELSHVAKLLGLAASFDQRTTGEADDQAWLAVLGDLDFDDARAALLDHYRDSTERIMPAHIRRGVQDIRQARLDACRVIPEPPEALGDYPAAYAEAARAIEVAICDGRDPGPAVAEITARTLGALNGGQA